jgi:DNA-binding NtrC family response regulator
MESPQILIADDEEDIRWALENILKTSGYSVACAASSQIAFSKLEKDSYFIAFVDIKIPDKDGFEIAAYISENHPKTSVVLISGYYNKEDDAILEAIQNGTIMGFISKPFELKEVRSLATQAFQRYREGIY